MSRRTPIGWRTTPLECEMRQGGSGTIRVRVVVLDDDGDPLPSYAGFTSILVFHGNGRASAFMSMPTVVGNADDQSLTIDITFQTNDTARVPPGKLVGDLCVIEPSGQRQFPLSISMLLHRSSAPAPEGAP